MCGAGVQTINHGLLTTALFSRVLVSQYRRNERDWFRARSKRSKTGLWQRHELALVRPGLRPET